MRCIGLKPLKGTQADPCRFRDTVLLETETDPSHKQKYWIHSHSPNFERNEVLSTIGG